MRTLIASLIVFALAQPAVLLADPPSSSQAAYSKEDVTFQNGAISLAGRVYMPRVQGWVPGVVFTHGSGDAGRDNFRYAMEAEYLADHGIAVLLYDKRGVGSSTGDWKTASFEDIAGDAVAAFKFLRSRPGIHSGRVGFRGASQSGYVLPIAAAREPAVAFVVLLSPPMVTPYEQILFNIESELRAAEFSQPEIDEALTYMRAGLDYVRTGEGWDTYAKLGTAAKETRWFEIAGGPDSKDDPMLSWLRMIIDFDVMPYAKKMKCPTLVFFAGHDRESPVDKAKPMIEGLFAERAVSRNRIVYYPDADHDLRVGKDLVPEYLPTLVGWIQERQARK